MMFKDIEALLDKKLSEQRSEFVKDLGSLFLLMKLYVSEEDIRNSDTDSKRWDELKNKYLHTQVSISEV